MSIQAVLVTDATLRPVTDPVDDWLELSAELKFNAVGAGELAAPATSAFVSAVNTPGNRIVIIRDTGVFAGGPIEKAPALQWNPEEGTQEARVTFATWEALLGHRITYPNPAAAAPGQGTATYNGAAVNGEVFMRNLVNLNAGPGALAGGLPAERRTALLSLGALASVGTNITLATRFEPLLDVLRAAALAAGGLGFRVRQEGLTLLFEVYQPVDRSKAVRFSQSLGNLVDVTTDPAAPTATVVIVGGNGEGATREVVERINAAAVTEWGRIEKFVSNSGSDVTTAELQQAGDAALVEAAEKAGLTVVAVDTKHARYGIDYQLGDRVAVEAVEGIAITDVVTAVKLTATPEAGEVISPAIGLGASSEPATVALLRQIERRLGRLERR